jgi:ribosomal protein L37AE/L43A
VSAMSRNRDLVQIHQDPKFRCSSCGLEFTHRVERDPDADVERERLFWQCRHCSRPTQAPFAGVPREILDGD